MFQNIKQQTVNVSQPLSRDQWNGMIWSRTIIKPITKLWSWPGPTVRLNTSRPNVIISADLTCFGFTCKYDNQYFQNLASTWTQNSDMRRIYKVNSSASGPANRPLQRLRWSCWELWKNAWHNTLQHGIESAASCSACFQPKIAHIALVNSLWKLA